MHTQAELGQLCGGALATEKVAAEFCLQLFDGPRQGWLGHVALVSSAREVEHAGDGEEVANLGHLHDRALPDLAGILADKSLHCHRYRNSDGLWFRKRTAIS